MEMRKKEEVIAEARRAEMRIEDISKIYDFTSEVVKKFGSFIKAVVVFGSFARKKEKESSDIDILVIVDDSFAPLDKALYLAYQNEMARLMKAYPKFHVTTVTISQFWDAARRGDPLVIQILRDGIALVDLGFFSPLKRLLVQGKIRPTDEAISAALSRAFYNLNGYVSALNGALNALYWAAVEAAHAGVMKFGKVPGSPWEVPKLLRETLLKEGAIGEEDIKAYEEAFELVKKIEKGEKDCIDPETLEKLHEKIVKFVTKVDAWINKKEIEEGLK